MRRALVFIIVCLFHFQDLNGVNLHNVYRGTSINATTRVLLCAAYGENATCNSLADGELHILLSSINKEVSMNDIYLQICVVRYFST